MTSPAHKPDLRQIGASAFTEVLDTLLSLPATFQESANDPAAVLEEISSSVSLAGERLSGRVHLRLPQAFVAYAVKRLAGLEEETENSVALQNDATGELANMVAGRVASQLAAHGYPCQLHPPSVSRGTSSAPKSQPGVACVRTDLTCAGHGLSLEIQCRYADS
jgi:CheY-specific phosphatase CheX